MCFNRAGRFLLFISVGSFILRHLGMQVMSSRTVTIMFGVGMGLMLLGAMFGSSSQPRNSASSASRCTPGYSVAPVPIIGQPTGLGLCAHCNNPLRPGARFCTRCGIAVAQPPPVIHAPPRPLPASRDERAPRKRFPLLRGLIVVALGIYGVRCFTTWRESGRVPWDDWKWAQDIGSSLTEYVDGPLPLPTSPEIGKSFPTSGGNIERAWVLTGAINEKGEVGLAVHAIVANNETPGERFAVHFRYDDFAPLYAAGTEYADPNGHAASIVRVPTVPRNVEVTAFIPYTALSLRSSTASLQLLAALYNSDNQQQGTCEPVPFSVYRGTTYITRVRLEGPASSYNKRLLVSFRSSESRSLVGAVVVRFKDEFGRRIPGQFQFTNPGGELKLTTGFSTSSTRGDVMVDDIPIEIPPGIVPARATAEISLYDSIRGTSLTPPLAFKMP